jgi:hypothetical protein
VLSPFVQLPFSSTITLSRLSDPSCPTTSLRPPSRASIPSSAGTRGAKIRYACDLHPVFSPALPLPHTDYLPDPHALIAPTKKNFPCARHSQKFPEESTR